MTHPEPLSSHHDLAPRPDGVLAIQDLRALIDAGVISSPTAFAPQQLQPASLDLRLGQEAFRIRASFLPGAGKSVAAVIDDFSMHRIDLGAGAVLEVGCVYLVPLEESLALPDDLSGIANPKSSTGRLNVFTRLITDSGQEFDRIPPGYHGPLYAEVAPNAFSILVRRGTSLNQLRLRRGAGPAALGDEELSALHAAQPLLGEPDTPATIRGGLQFSVDLSGVRDKGLVGFRAKRHTGVIDLSCISHYEPRDFWEALPASPQKRLILDPHEFYILATQEAVVIPPSHAAEMIAYDTQVGEFRVHYAGFFDPGFGFSETEPTGTRAVLEVRSHEVPFALEHGQAVGRLLYDHLASAPEILYGQGIGSSYAQQGLSLSKHFKAW